MPIKISVNPRYFQIALNLVPDFIIASAILIITGNSSFLGQGYINFGDVDFPFFPNRQLLTTSVYIWNAHIGTGGLYPSPFTAPYYFIIYGLNEIGLPLLVVNRIIFILPLIMAGWFSYYLGLSLFNGKYTKVSALVLSIFFLSSSGIAFVLGNPKFAISLSALPLFLAFILRGLKSNNLWKYSSLAAITSAVIAIEPKIFVLTLITIALFLFFYSLFAYKFIRFNVKFTLKFICVMVVVSFLINLYWLIPTLATIIFHENFLVGFRYASSALPYADRGQLIWRLRLFWFESSFLKSNPILTMASFIIPMFAYLAILSRKNKAVAYSFAIVSLVLTMFSTGIYHPVSRDIYLFLWKYVTLFQVFRDCNVFVLPLSLVYACLIGISTHALLNHCSGKVQTKKGVGLKIVTIGMLSTIIIIQGVAGPFLYLNIFQTPNLGMNVPQDYYDLNNYLNSPDNLGYRFLVLPWAGWYLKYTWWNASDTPDIVQFFSPIATLQGPSDLATLQGPMGQMIQQLDNAELDDAARLMGFLNIRYILIHFDLMDYRPEFNYPVKQSQLKLLFDSNPTLFILVKNYTFFGLYELNNSFIAPPIYVVPSTTFPSFALENQTYFYWDRYIPCEFEIIDPTSYVANVNTDSPFIIILGQQYDTSWEAYVNGESISPSNHFMANGYANAWFINKTGKLDIKLQFGLQRFVLPSFLVSISTFIGILLSVSARTLRKRNKSLPRKIERFCIYV